MGKTAILDADYLLYRVGFGKKEYPVEDAIVALDEILYDIFAKVPSDYQLLFLSDSKNCFRLKVDPTYKANRKQDKPEHFEALKEHLIGVWCAEVADGMEADDALSLNNVNTDTHTTVLISIDKDLLQVPGNHYNPMKDLHFEVSPIAALYNFYTQLLVGDSTDNVKGVPGIGKVRAEKLLKDCVTEGELLNIARKSYANDVEMRKNASLLWLLSNDRKCMALEEPCTQK